MFHKFISNHQIQEQQETSREQSNHDEDVLQWEHRHMMRQDLQGLFYRKLNYIVMLQQSEQAYQQRQILMISHRENHQENKKNQTLNIHPVTFLAKSMVKHNQKLRKQLQIRKKEGEAQIQLSKYQTDKKCLIAQIGVFADKLKQIAYNCYSEQELIKSEDNLLEHARKYSLTSPIMSYISSVKQITTRNIISDCLKQSLKKNTCKALKLEELNLPFAQVGNKKELLDHINLYLKEFKSSAIFKELSQLLSQFAQTYHQINLNSHYLYNKIVSQINSNLALLSKVGTQIQNISNQLKDYRIQIQILAQQSKTIKEQIGMLQEKSGECIAEEAAYLSREYNQSKNYQFDEQFCEQQDFNAYFHDKLKAKYQQFIQHQLEDAEHIYILKQKIQEQAKFINQLQTDFTRETSVCSQLMTHRSIQPSIYSSLNCTLQQLNVNNNIERNQLKKQGELVRQSMVKKSLVRERLQQGKQKFIVKKELKIRCNSKNNANKSKQNEKVYEMRVTSKHLILQEKTPSCLRINQRIQLQNMKGYRLQAQNCIQFSCGANSLRLQFLSSNTKRFLNRLEQVLKQLKANRHYGTK